MNHLHFIPPFPAFQKLPEIILAPNIPVISPDLPVVSRYPENAVVDFESMRSVQARLAGEADECSVEEGVCWRGHLGFVFLFVFQATKCNCNAGF